MVVARHEQWSTGQDQVAAIKRQLCLLVPGIHVFLDVDVCCCFSILRPLWVALSLSSL
jgi:hypothetical protein